MGIILAIPGYAILKVLVTHGYRFVKLNTKRAKTVLSVLAFLLTIDVHIGVPIDPLLI